MEIALSALAERLGLPLRGSDRQVSGVGPLESAGPQDVSFISAAKYAPLLKTTRAGAVICTEEFAGSVDAALVSANPALDFARLLELFSPPQGRFSGVSDRAFVDPQARVAEGATVFPLAYVGPGAEVGPGSRIFPGCYVGEDCRIGRDCTLYPNVTLMARTVLGDRVMVHPGAVLGADGFGYVPRAGGGRDKIPQVGTLVVEDDVEIGANTTIDRAMLEKTVIGRGTKIDNLVQVAHNCVLGENCTIIAQVGIAGSCTVGRDVIMAGQAGIADHVRIGDGAVVGPICGVRTDIAPGMRMGGIPAMEYGTYMRNLSLAPKIPDLFKRVRQLEKALEALGGAPGQGGRT